jgi:alkaline phosphatase D
MRITRRKVLAGGAGLGALGIFGCDPAAKPTGDSGDTGAGTPTRAPEPAPWDAPGTEDTAAFAWGVQSGDTTTDMALVSIRTTEQLVTLVLMEGVEDTWVEVERVEGLVPDDRVVQVSFEGLQPDTAYSFTAYAADPSRRSPVGRFRTALPAGVARVVTFGAVSCIGGNEPWPSLSHAAAENLDFFCLLGDTIYADYGTDAFQYETKWDTALSTQGLRDVTASTSLIATWDDHEVANNYSFETTEGIDALFPEGLAAFRRALPLGVGPGGGIWRKLSWGPTLDVLVLDCRGERRDGNYISVAQMDWLKAELLSSTARFKIVLNSVPITDLSAIFGSAQQSDRWSGYPTQRAEILSHIRDNGVEGVLWITGDVHYAQIGRVDPAGGVGEDQWEVLAGPGGSTLNAIVEAFVGSEQYPVIFAQWNWARFTCDPGAGTITVTYIGDDGGVLAEKVLDLLGVSSG